MYRLVLLFLVLFPLGASAQFELVGDAEEIGPSTFRMTKDELNENGSVWHKLRHDFRTDFSVKGEFYFGDFEDGADGIVFVIQDNCIGSGGLGLGIGYLNFPGRSIGVEFDTYQNAGGQVNDPVDDHIALSRDGSVNHLNNLIGPVQMHPSQSNVEDGNWYSYEISYDATSERLDVYFAGDLRLSYQVDIVDDILAGDPFAYWGFTSATGGFSAANSLSIDEFDSFAISDYLLCDDEATIEFSIPYDDVEFSITPIDGVSIDGNIVQIQTETTTQYTLVLPDICLGSVEYDFAVEVSEVIASITSESIGENPGCVLSSGSITASGENGTEPYTYLWSNGEVEASITDLDFDAIYSVTVTDANFCTGVAALETFSDVILVSSQTDIACHGDTTGFIGVAPSFGTEPYEYFWDLGGGNTQVVYNIVAGDYQITVVDGNGCTDSKTVTITEPESPLSLTILQSGTIACDEVGTVSASVEVDGGTPPYNITWSNGDTGPVANNLTVGEYQVSVIDDNNCMLSDVVLVTVESPFSVDVIIEHIVCADQLTGALTLELTGTSPPYQYSIDNGMTTQLDNTFDNLPPGTYTILIEDAEGCTVTIDTTIAELTVTTAFSAGSDQVISPGESIVSDAFVGTPLSITEIQWTPSSSITCSDCINPTFSSTVTTLYTMTVIDSNGCILTDDVLITVDDGDFNVFIPNIIAPSSGGVESNFQLYGDAKLALISRVAIYDRWGNLVYSAKDQDPDSYQGWDGTFGGDPVEVGVYVYMFEIELTNGQLHNFSGDVMVVR